MTGKLTKSKDRKGASSTRDVSRAANRSMGIMKRKKKIERIAKPFAARVCREKPLALRSSHGLVNEQVRTTTP